ncbi:MAG TPA: VOC family protein [Phenylobacterium sp.]|uniref:VOC family protein n=1 Tax=Phenylobacterium sp. TaxID=1871053 RepID=UPI002D0F7754|nr:VOC family protein [Phenylobacterium sp.]HSV04300.1 VOC family protein [Phenylobacterium sp.]
MQARFTYAIRFTDDMEGAVAFFRDRLGLKLRFYTPFWSEFETGDVTLALHPASPANPAGNVQLGFATDDVVRLHAEAETEGLIFSAAPKDEHGTKLATIRDPEGAEISLTS